MKQKIYNWVQYEIFYKPDNGHNYQKFFFEFHVWIVYHFCPSHARAKFQFFGNLQNHDRPTLISRMVWNQMIAIINWNLTFFYTSYLHHIDQHHMQKLMKNRKFVVMWEFILHFSIRECFKNIPTNDIYVNINSFLNSKRYPPGYSLSLIGHLFMKSITDSAKTTCFGTICRDANFM